MRKLSCRDLKAGVPVMLAFLSVLTFVQTGAFAGNTVNVPSVPAASPGHEQPASAQPLGNANGQTGLIDRLVTFLSPTKGEAQVNPVTKQDAPSQTVATVPPKKPAVPKKNTKKPESDPTSWDNRLSAALQSNDLSQAATLLQRYEKAGAKPAALAQWRSRLASMHLFAGQAERALAFARQSIKATGHRPVGADAPVTLAFWTAGLASWQLGEYRASGHYFERYAQQSSINDWGRSAGAYWAARAFQRDGQQSVATAWLERAARHTETFYGLIASEALGRAPSFDWSRTAFRWWGQPDVTRNPAVRDAALHLTEGRRMVADRELATDQSLPASDKNFWRALLDYADREKLPRTAMRAARILQASERHAAGMYPVSPWTPREGFSVDQALIHAIILQESKFNPKAVSPRGATGLMQLMPAAVKEATPRSTAKTETIKAVLTNPVDNLSVGQRYVSWLLDHPQVEGNLFYLAIAYNAGPGKLARWRKNASETALNDPLFFIETIPVSETRAYVERLMTNYWIYSHRLGQGLGSLEAVVKGQEPLYTNPANRFLWQIAAR